MLELDNFNLIDMRKEGSASLFDEINRVAAGLPDFDLGVVSHVGPRRRGDKELARIEKKLGSGDSDFAWVICDVALKEIARQADVLPDFPVTAGVVDNVSTAGISLAAEQAVCPAKEGSEEAVVAPKNAAAAKVAVEAKAKMAAPVAQKMEAMSYVDAPKVGWVKRLYDEIDKASAGLPDLGRDDHAWVAGRRGVRGGREGRQEGGKMADQPRDKGKGKGPSAAASAFASNVPTSASSRPQQEPQQQQDGASILDSSIQGGRPVVSLANSLAASLRSTMAGNQLGSLLASASGGKGEFAAYHQPGQQQGGGSISNDDLRASMLADLSGSSSSRSGPGASGSSGSTTFPSATHADNGSAQARLASQQFDTFAALHLASTSNVPTWYSPTTFEASSRAQQGLDAYSPDRIGAYGCSADLDHALHAQVRAVEGLHVSDSAGAGMDAVWRDAEASARSLTAEQREFAQDADWNARWASGLGGVEFPPPSLHVEQARQISTAPSEAHSTATDASSDFMALLSADEAKETVEGPCATEYAKPAWDRTSAGTLSSLPTQWRPPSPSLPAHLCVTRQQLEMHRALSAAQTDGEHAIRQVEGIAPRADDEETREGVYAATAEEALRGNFEGRGGEKVKEVQADGEGQEGEWSVERGQRAVQRIVEWLPHSSYVDDVYGLPPTLADTMRKAVGQPSTAPDGTLTEDSRKKAIQRLEALWGHLSNTRPTASTTDTSSSSSPSPPAVLPRAAGTADWMEAWLKGQPR